jgi:transcriptional regulator GlxA family with amidase domain
MTNTPEIAPTPASRKPLVLFVAFPGMCMLDMAGPQTAFWAATKGMEARGLPVYERRTVSWEGGVVPTLEGVGFDTEPLADFAVEDIDTIIVPGAADIEKAVAVSAPLVAWLRDAAAVARRTASVCSGTFMLAEAGLLEGKCAATHWILCDMLQEHHPSITIDRDAIFVREGKIWTSAGVTAGIDLALALIEEDCGRDVALQVARELVVFLKRPGGQAQFSAMLHAQTQDSLMFDDLHLWIADNLGSETLTVEFLAERARMSPRNFARVYKEKTGRTPAKAVEIFRLEAARRLLEESRRNIDQIARQCGFGDEERMRVTFQRNLGIAPSEYRSRFSASRLAEMKQ